MIDLRHPNPPFRFWVGNSQESNYVLNISQLGLLVGWCFVHVSTYVWGWDVDVMDKRVADDGENGKKLTLDNWHWNGLEFWPKMKLVNLNNRICERIARACQLFGDSWWRNSLNLAISEEENRLFLACRVRLLAVIEVVGGGIVITNEGAAYRTSMRHHGPLSVAMAQVVVEIFSEIWIPSCS